MPTPPLPESSPRIDPDRSLPWSAVAALAIALAGCVSGHGTDDEAPARDAGVADAAPDAAEACGDRACAPCPDTPWGTVPHGFTGTAYLSATPAGPCTAETRTCTDGTMSGTFVAAACAAGCAGTPWGDVTSGFAGTAFRDPVAPFGTTCQATAQSRTCVEGVLSGSYANPACTNYPCAWGGAMVRHATAAFEAATFPSVFHECALDGTWGAALPGNPVALGTPCEHEGRWFEDTTCGYFQGATYRCQSGAWLDAPSCPPGP